MKTDYSYIRELLDKFYEGTSTSDEEIILSGFFSNTSDLPEEFKADRQVFQAMEESLESTSIPPDLEQKILKSIDIKISNGPGRQSKAIHMRKLIRRTLIITSAAAVFILIFMIPFIAGIGDDMQAEKNLIAHTDTISLDNNHDETAALTSESNVSGDIASETPSDSENQGKTYMAASKTTCQVGSSKHTSKNHESIAPATGKEEITLSEEEIKAINLGLSALAKAGRQLAYTQECIETTDRAVDKSISEIKNALDK